MKGARAPQPAEAALFGFRWDREWSNHMPVFSSRQLKYQKSVSHSSVNYPALKDGASCFDD